MLHSQGDKELSLDDDIRIIGSAQLFDALQPEQLRLLAFGAERLRYNAGRVIYHQDDRADCGFVIASGKISLFKTLNGEQQIVQTAGAGEILGEMAMLTETQRLTGAVADTDCELIRISRALFTRMLSEYPETAAQIHADLSARFKTFLTDISRLNHRFGGARDL